MNKKIQELKQLRDTLTNKYDDEIIQQNEQILITPLRDFLDAYAQKMVRKHPLYCAVMNINNYKLKRIPLVLDLVICNKQQIEKNHNVGSLTVEIYEQVLNQNGLKYGMNITDNDKNKLMKLFYSKQQHTLKK